MKEKFKSYRYQEVVKGKTVTFTLLPDLEVPDVGKVTSIACIPYKDTSNIIVTKLQRGYDIPGGHVEKTDENLRKALERELTEEVGITVGENLVVIGIISSDFYDEESFMLITATKEIRSIDSNFKPQLESRGREIMSDTRFLEDYHAGDKTLMNMLFMRARILLGFDPVSEERLFPSSKEQWNTTFKEGKWSFLKQDNDEYYRLEKIANEISSSKCFSVLDIGCAYANLLQFLDDSRRYHGIDIADIIINKNSLQYSSKKNVKFSVCDFTKDSVTLDEKYASIVASEILYYLDDKQLDNFIRNTNNYLDKNGVFIVSMCRSDRADIHPTSYYWNQINKHFTRVNAITHKGTKYTWDIGVYKK